MRSLLNFRHPLDGARSICWLSLFLAFAISQPKWVDAQEGTQLDAERIFESGRIINVEIEIEDDNWEALSNQTRDFLSALSGSANQKVFTYFPANVTIDGVKIENVGVRKKGFLGSLDKERPSLKIKFSEYEDKSISKGFDRLTLNNNKQDPSRLCQVLSYEIFNESGSIAPRCNFARVTVNGKHLGIYSNVESIKEPFLKARFGDGTGALYEGTTTDLLPGFASRLEAKNKAAKHEAVLALTKLLEDQKLPLEEIKSRLDVESFLRFWATESLIGFWDGYSQNQNNYFVYRVPETGKFQFIPWGLDSAFTQDSPLPQLRSKTKSVYVQGALANHFYRDQGLRKQYEQAMRELLENHWNEEALLAKVDRLAESIRDEIVPENRRGFEARIREIKKFITDRRDQVTKELVSGKIVVEHGPRRPIGIEQVGTAKGTFKTQWYDKSPRKPVEQGEAVLTVEIEGEELKFKKLGVVSEASQDRNARESDGRMPPTVAYHGVRESDNKQWLLVLSTSSAEFRSSDEPSKVGGLIIVGNPIWFFARMMMGGGDMSQLVFVGGTVTFDSAKREDGAVVSGSVDLVITRFVGGDHLSIRP